jgi:hypothetical protein
MRTTEKMAMTEMVVATETMKAMETVRATNKMRKQINADQETTREKIIKKCILYVVCNIFYKISRIRKLKIKENRHMATKPTNIRMKV